MSIADRKRRAWEERDRLILETADSLLADHGYLGLNLDELARQIEYSKATIYNHYESKEDLMLAVATTHLETRAEFFGRALTFEGRSRERLFVIGFADMLLAQLYPHWFSILQLVSSPSIWDKATEERHMQHEQSSERCMKAALEIIRQARVAGDLPEDSPSDQHILAGLVGMAKGSHLLAYGPGGFPPELNLKPLDLLFDNYQIYLDGTGWKPLGNEWDYDQTLVRIREELFTKESAIEVHS
ncbi:MAG: TetR/AcrR family transcriptional regulator [Verrucomicrobiota bacterium]